MKKRIEKISAKPKSIFNKLGMTYIELICALALLSLIVVMFTPMLLSSYEQLYNAGEKIVETYDSKKELEEGLARRDSEIGASFNITLAIQNVGVNADILFQNINVQGRKVVSYSRDKLETVFGQQRPSLMLLSPAHVNDDKSFHDILIQTKGLEFTSIEQGNFHAKYSLDGKDSEKPKLDSKTIFLEVMLPNKTSGGGGNNDTGDPDSTEEEAVYNGDAGYFCDVEVISNDTVSDGEDSGESVSNLMNEGKLKLRISHDKLDFTYSPVKINVYYVNTRGKTRTISEYIHIDPPTIMMAGETKEADYYTSAGVQESFADEENSAGERPAEYSLVVYPRLMRTSNSPYLNNAGSYTKSVFGSPKSQNVEIRSIRWIDNDQTDGVKPYYVMTGTKGAIYRMYNFSSENADVYKYSVKGASKDTSTGYFNTATGSSIDKIFILKSTGEKILPAVWSGDSSHVFEYSSAKQKVTYGPSVNNKDGDLTWITSTDQKGVVGADKYNVFNTQAEYAYYYNGSGTTHTFKSKNSRPISYILTERGWPIRAFGVVGGGDDGYVELTERWDTDVYNETKLAMKDLKDSHVVYAFIGASTVLMSGDVQEDYHFGQIRIKAMASYDMSQIKTNNSDILKAVDYWDTSEDYSSSNSMAKLRTVRRGQGHDETDRIEGLGSNINITDAIYIPAANGVGGTTFYVGNVNAFANLVQSDRINKEFTKVGSGLGSGDGWRHYRYGLSDLRLSFPHGATTDFIIYGTDDGTGTYINKFSCKNTKNRPDANNRRYIFGEMSKYVRGEDTEISFVTGSDIGTRNNFFYPDHTGTWTSKPEEISGSQYMYIPDLEFTFGYASNRERVYTYITYDGSTKTEFMRSFERLYWRSHYGQDMEKDANLQKAFYGDLLEKHTQNKALNSGGNLSTSGHRNSVNNDYYNVWFPGEMYNLSKIASKDGVTVAVGYAVAGSAFQYAHSTDPDNLTSTALGGIYNDGVLSAMIEGQDSSFVNLLYYKDNSNNNADRTKDSFDDDWLTTNESTKNSYSAYGSYGMHTRDSVKFTAVDIFVQETNKSSDGKTTTLEYWAFYGDSKGRVFKSLIATGTATSSGTGDPDDEDSKVTTTKNINLVSYVKDDIVNDQKDAKSVVSNMRQIVTDDGYTLDVAFKKITSIEAKDDMVIITGEKQEGLNEIIVVGVCKDGVWSWRWHENGDFKGDITDAMILNGYYYFIGNDPDADQPFIGAIPLEYLKNLPNTERLVTSGKDGYASSKNEVIWTYVSESDIKLYALAGRVAN